MELRYKVMDVDTERYLVVDSRKGTIVTYSEGSIDLARVIAATLEWADMLENIIGDVELEDFVEEVSVNTLEIPIPDNELTMEWWDDFTYRLIPAALRVVADRIESKTQHKGDELVEFRHKIISTDLNESKLTPTRSG